MTTSVMGVVAYDADIQEYYEVTLLDDQKSLQQKTSETNQVASRWDRPPAANSVIRPPQSVSVFSLSLCVLCINTPSADILLRPRAGSWVVRLDLLRFLAGCHKKQLNQVLPVLSLSLGFLRLCVVLLTRESF